MLKLNGKTVGGVASDASAVSYGDSTVNDELNNLNDIIGNDYSSETITIPLDTNYTCPSDGIIRYGAYGTGMVKAFVNNFNIGIVYGGGQANSSPFNSWRVRKNDIVKIVKVYGEDTNISVHIFNPYL